MIVLSNALAKSGSTLLFACTRDLVKAATQRNGQDVLSVWIQDGRVHGMGEGYVHAVDFPTTKALLTIDRRYGSIVTKCHTGVTPMMRSLAESGRAKVTYIHRDPRDVILSAMDHRKRTQHTDSPTYPEYVSVSAAIPHVNWRCEFAVSWVKCGLAFVSRYVDIVSRPTEALAGVAAYLGLEVDSATLRRIVDKHTRHAQQGTNQFNTGRPTRFRQEMNAEDISLCNKKLGREIQALGYSL
ncbi:sulfotransferase domain-containing protein [Verrucomicrobiota bacterium]